MRQIVFRWSTDSVSIAFAYDRYSVPFKDVGTLATRLYALFSPLKEGPFGAGGVPQQFVSEIIIEIKDTVLSSAQYDAIAEFKDAVDEGVRER